MKTTKEESSESHLYLKRMMKACILTSDIFSSQILVIPEKYYLMKFISLSIWYT